MDSKDIKFPNDIEYRTDKNIKTTANLNPYYKWLFDNYQTRNLKIVDTENNNFHVLPKEEAAQKGLSTGYLNTAGSYHLRAEISQNYNKLPPNYIAHCIRKEDGEINKNNVENNIFAKIFSFITNEENYHICNSPYNIELIQTVNENKELIINWSGCFHHNILQEDLNNITVDICVSLNKIIDYIISSGIENLEQTDKTLETLLYGLFFVNTDKGTKLKPYIIRIGLITMLIEHYYSTLKEKTTKSIDYLKQLETKILKDKWLFPFNGSSNFEGAYKWYPVLFSNDTDKTKFYDQMKKSDGTIFPGENSVKLNQSGKTYIDTEEKINKNNMIQLDFQHSRTNMKGINFDSITEMNKNKLKSLSELYLNDLLLNQPTLRENILTPTPSEYDPLDLKDFCQSSGENATYNSGFEENDIKYFMQGFDTNFKNTKLKQIGDLRTKISFKDNYKKQILTLVDTRFNALSIPPYYKQYYNGFIEESVDINSKNEERHDNREVIGMTQKIKDRKFSSDVSNHFVNNDKDLTMKDYSPFVVKKLDMNDVKNKVQLPIYYGYEKESYNTHADGTFKDGTYSGNGRMRGTKETTEKLPDAFWNLFKSKGIPEVLELDIKLLEDIRRKINAELYGFTEQQSKNLKPEDLIGKDGKMTELGKVVWEVHTTSLPYLEFYIPNNHPNPHSTTKKDSKIDEYWYEMGLINTAIQPLIDSKGTKFKNLINTSVLLNVSDNDKLGYVNSGGKDTNFEYKFKRMGIEHRSFLTRYFSKQILHKQKVNSIRDAAGYPSYLDKLPPINLFKNDDNIGKVVNWNKPECWTEFFNKDWFCKATYKSSNDNEKALNQMLETPIYLKPMGNVIYDLFKGIFENRKIINNYNFDLKELCLYYVRGEKNFNNLTNDAESKILSERYNTTLSEANANKFKIMGEVVNDKVKNGSGDGSADGKTWWDIFKEWSGRNLTCHHSIFTSSPYYTNISKWLNPINGNWPKSTADWEFSYPYCVMVDNLGNTAAETKSGGAADNAHHMNCYKIGKSSFWDGVIKGKKPELPKKLNNQPFTYGMHSRLFPGWVSDFHGIMKRFNENGYYFAYGQDFPLAYRITYKNVTYLGSFTSLFRSVLSTTKGAANTIFPQMITGLTMFKTTREVRAITQLTVKNWLEKLNIILPELLKDIFSLINNENNKHVFVALNRINRYYAPNVRKEWNPLNPKVKINNLPLLPAVAGNKDGSLTLKDKIIKYKNPQFKTTFEERYYGNNVEVMYMPEIDYDDAAYLTRQNYNYFKKFFNDSIKENNQKEICSVTKFFLPNYIVDSFKYFSNTYGVLDHDKKDLIEFSNDIPKNEAEINKQRPFFGLVNVKQFNENYKDSSKWKSFLTSFYGEHIDYEIASNNYKNDAYIYSTLFEFVQNNKKGSITWNLNSLIGVDDTKYYIIAPLKNISQKNGNQFNIYNIQHKSIKLKDGNDSDNETIPGNFTIISYDQMINLPKWLET